MTEQVSQLPCELVIPASEMWITNSPDDHSLESWSYEFLAQRCCFLSTLNILGFTDTFSVKF